MHEENAVLRDKKGSFNSHNVLLSQIEDMQKIRKEYSNQNKLTTPRQKKERTKRQSIYKKKT